MSNLYTEEIVPIKCGAMSLIGVWGERPLRKGNYFWLAIGPRVANFWWENLETANEKFKLEDKIKIRRYQIEKRDWCLIDDERIPEDWYYNKLCFTGTYPPPIEILTDMYEYIGDPNNELQQYTDPKTYWESKGATYKNGFIIHKATVDPDLKPLKFKGKILRDDAIIIAPYIPNFK